MRNPSRTLFDEIFYINFGAPTLAQSANMLRRYYAQGARSFQIDLPSPAPYLEHPGIARRMQQSLEHCPGFAPYLNQLEAVRSGQPDAHWELTLYEDTIRQAGLGTVLAFCKRCRISFVSLLPLQGLPLQFAEAFSETGCTVLRPLPLSQPAEAQKAAASGQNRVILMLDGDDFDAQMPVLSARVGALRKAGVVAPLYCTMGIRTPVRAAAVQAAGANGCYIGSCLIDLWETPDAFDLLLREFLATPTSKAGGDP